METIVYLQIIHHCFKFCLKLFRSKALVIFMTGGNSISWISISITKGKRMHAIKRPPFFDAL